MKTPTIALLGLVIALPAAAAPIHPMQSYMQRFESGASAEIYYVAQHDGLHVVTTTQTADRDHPTFMRFTTTLAPGQVAYVTLPRGAAQPNETLKLARIGDHLQVAQAAEIASN